MISNLKIKPGRIAQSPTRNYYKQQAINHAAAALRNFLPRTYAEHSATFVPIPGSKAAGDSDYDDRMLRVLQRALQGWTADIRPMLELTDSTPADHETTDRLSYDELLAISRLTDSSGQPLRQIVVVVDDVLNSGKHFKVAQALISERYPTVEIRGLFLARCVRDNRFADFPIVDTV